MTVAGAVVTTLEGIFGGIVNAIAWFIGLVCSIPYVGRTICLIWEGILTAINWIISIPDFILGLLGILPEKRLRLCIIIQHDQRGSVASDSEVLSYLQRAIDVFKQQANVRILPVGPFNYGSAFQDTPTASMDYVHTEAGVSSADTLDVACGVDGFGDDFGSAGSKFNEGVRDARSDGDSVRPAARVQERTSGSEDVPDAVRQLRRACMARQRRAGASPTPLRRRVPAWTPFPRAARACLAAPSS